MIHAFLLLVSLAACGGGAEVASHEVAQPEVAQPEVTTPPPAAAAVTGRRVDVTVDGSGYTPASVEAAPGEALHLVFRRVDENNCGGTLVFPASGERHELPVGEEVAVEVTAPADGRLAFTCGMGMYQGAVVVTGS